MLGRSAGALAASALTASAFLIPAGIDPAKADVPDANWMLDMQSASRLVRMPCSACVFWSAEENINDAENDIFRIQGGAHDVLLNYTVAHDGETLLMNDERIFQLQDGEIVGMFKEMIYVEQVPASADWMEILDGDVARTRADITGAGLTITDLAVLENGASVAQLKIVITHLDGGSGRNIDVKLGAVFLDLVQPKDGKLMILGVGSEEREHTELPPPPYPKHFFDSVEGVEDQPADEDVMAHHPHPPHFENEGGKNNPWSHGPFTAPGCKSLPPPVCRLKQILQSKFSGMRKGGCAGRKGGPPHNGVLPTHIRPPPFPRPKFEVDGVPHHHMRPHGHHHGHHPGFQFLHALVRGIATLLIPALAGVAVGMAVSMVGLAVGRLISFLWIHIVRGGRRGNASVALEEDSAAKGELLKTSFEEEEERESLPLYEDAPAYEETEKGAQ